MVRKGATRREVRKKFKKKDIDPDIIDSVVDRVQEENSKQSFWSFTKDGKISIVHISFKEFLEEHGFYKFNPETLC